jgi:primosomal protein N' (replication factor Y)
MPGTLVRVPLGQRELLGVVWRANATPANTVDPGKLRTISGVLEGIEPLTPAWQQLLTFAAQYYQRSPGEVALAALPPQLREINTAQLARRLRRHARAADVTASAACQIATTSVALSHEQTRAIDQFNTQNGPFLLFGATGSGKTEVYLHTVQQLLARDPGAQAW